MPTYTYACKSCGQAFDIHQSFTDEALTVCPNCGGELRKKFGNVGVVFKGGGFYRTDSQSGSSSRSGSVPAEKKDTSGAGTSESSGSGSTKESASTSGSTTSDSSAAASS